MKRSAEDDVPALCWHALPAHARNALDGRLDGLYGNDGDERAFDALAPDKQQALLIFVERLLALNLWRAVRRIENVYGTGGVGLNFNASPLLARALRLREDFTTLFAAHRRTQGADSFRERGFRERRRARAVLHFLLDGREVNRPRWSAHFDLYSPLASPLSAWRHFYFESLRRGASPDWRVIARALKDEKGGSSVF